MAKLLVVTGGSRGIGKAILEKFAAGGFDVCTCSRSKADLEKLSRELTDRYGIKVHYFVADMSVKEQVKGFTDFVTSLKRPVDVLVNNAGYFLSGQVIDEPEGTLETMIESNLYSAYYTTRGLAPGMRQARSGHIFNICSIASIQAYPNGASYAISKHAMLGLSKVLREELKPHGVRVTAVLPGAVLTDSWKGAGLPDERFITVQDIADAVWSAYGLSPRSVVEEILIRPQLGDI
ncbi:MAG TPA: SDR family oxidoreductase [Cyclobacteriaceae bacterium]|nr:SDR family oxidoreductase [Cyclobacteriaceae bacterium]